MDEYTEYLQRFRPSQPFAATDVNMEMEMLKQIPELNSSVLGNSSLSNFSVEYLLAHQQPEFPTTYRDYNISNTFSPDILSPAPIIHTVALDQSTFPESKARDSLEQPISSFKSTSPTTSTTNTARKKSPGRGMKGKNKEKEGIKAEEFIQVRAKRGQATDSHSMAERIRRKKINNKLRYLQDLVPGCHKSMGMAVMLEEIINYVHSLQNQVEFLSMELAAASCSYDPNFKAESSKAAQETHSNEILEMQKRSRELTCFHSTWSI